MQISHIKHSDSGDTQTYGPQTQGRQWGREVKVRVISNMINVCGSAMSGDDIQCNLPTHTAGTFEVFVCARVQLCRFKQVRWHWSGAREKAAPDVCVFLKLWLRLEGRQSY